MVSPHVFRVFTRTFRHPLPRRCLGGTLINVHPECDRCGPVWFGWDPGPYRLAPFLALLAGCRWLEWLAGWSGWLKGLKALKERLQRVDALAVAVAAGLAVSLSTKLIYIQ